MDDIHYREYKILLRPERFFDAGQFKVYWEKVRVAAEAAGVGVETAHGAFHRLVREVLFYDTPERALNANAFILRKRIFYTDGWPDARRELTLKFRHPDLKAAAAVDVTPFEPVDAVIKFKEEILTLEERIGGSRRLFSHNCELTTPQLEIDQGLAHIVKLFPCLAPLLPPSADAQVVLVNNLPVEEIMVEAGRLDFGHGVVAKATVALWRNRATERAIIGEFAFQMKFDDYARLDERAGARAQHFFETMQTSAPEWVALGATKTAAVYASGAQTQPGHE